jgi:CRISPR system Cascade subunit CasE
MYMSRITLSPTATLADVARIAADDAYADHRILWRLFPDGQPRREFLFRRMEHRGRRSFLVVSPVKPTSSSPAWIIESKAYEPGLEEGDRLTFSLRANPVVRRRTESGRQVRHDVVMDAKRRFREQHPDKPAPMVELISEAGREWLETRVAGLGFTLEPGRLRCDGYRRHRLVRRNRQITFSTVDFDGVLRLSDPDRFVDALFRGVGPSKAFGCGLLLVRRV